MKRYVLSISMLFALSLSAQSVQKNDCGTCVGAANSGETKELISTNNQNSSVIIQKDELTLVNSEITEVILELRKANIVTQPEYVNTNDELLDKKNYLTELKKLLPEEKK